MKWSCINYITNASITRFITESSRSVSTHCWIKILVRNNASQYRKTTTLTASATVIYMTTVNPPMTVCSASASPVDNGDHHRWDDLACPLHEWPEFQVVFFSGHLSVPSRLRLVVSVLALKCVAYYSHQDLQFRTPFVKYNSTIATNLVESSE